MKKTCQRVEELQKAHDEFQIHKELKTMAGMYKTKKPMFILNKEGKPIIKEEEVCLTWETYVTNLFKANRN